MNEQDAAVSILTGFSIDKLLNTVDFIEEVVGRNGMIHGDKLALEFCKKAGINRMNAIELVQCLGKAVNRKMLLMNPEEGEQERPNIIH